MSEASEREDLSYFKFGLKHNQSSSGSTPISPSTTIERAPTPVSSQRIRPAFKHGPHSDYSSIHSRVKVQTIREDVAVSKVPNTLGLASQLRPPSRTTGRRSTSHGSDGPITPVRLSSEGSRDSTGSTQNEVARVKPGSEASVNPPTRPRPGHVWSRSKSGSIWYERLKHSPGPSHKSSKSSTDSHSVPKRLLTPLRPPLAAVPGPVYHHKVKVETSFTELRADQVPLSEQVASQARASLTSKNTSRRSSIDPRRLFYAPLLLVRKLSKQPQKAEASSTRTKPASPRANSKLQLPDHKSLLRRNQTGEALKQVTSILERTPAIVINPFSTRVLSDKSATGSYGSGKQKHVKKMEKGLVQESAVAEQRSLQNLLELEHNPQSSTQLIQPQNTPDERATYKIKRSLSAESEEFLKIDISVRGGTSYLPSEARRIHTPPLPQDGLDGKKRGFFFDYNAPKDEASRKASMKIAASEASLPAKLPRRDTSKASTIGRRALSFKKRPTGKTKAGDWYDAKLAELENDDDDESLLRAEKLEPTGSSRGRSTTATSCSEWALAKKKKEEEQMDYNIPEHLPSSPLCPRNKRYWRVVQGRGSQYRGCWMHGVGEYE